MEPVPKKTRKISQSDSTHVSRQELTSSDDPLAIRGFSLFDRQYKELTVHSQICDTIRGSLEGISDPGAANVTFQIGKLLSVVQPRNICLPVETEAVLDYDFNKVKFVPGVAPNCMDALYLKVFANHSNNAKLVPHLDYFEVELVHQTKHKNGKAASKKSEGLCHSRIYRVPYNDNETLDFGELRAYVRNELESLIVYRPQSEYHLRVQTQSVVAVADGPEELGATVSKVLFRHVRTYRPSKLKDVKDVKLDLEVIDQWDVPTNEELLKLPVTEMAKAFHEALIASSAGKLYAFLDLDNSEESKVKIIQLSSACDGAGAGAGSQLSRQHKRLLDAKPNRFDYIVSLLEANARMLLDLFDAGAGPGDADDFYPNLFGDTSEHAQIHYDTRKVVRQQESAIEALRKYNNLVKRILILANIKQNASVLELACGHAQDLDKYNAKKVRRLMGIDISLREINEARRRYAHRKRTLSFTAEFHHGNILDPKVFGTFVKNNRFDVVSVQLAIHYILESEASASFILERVHGALNDGGLFIGSTVCCAQLARELDGHPPAPAQEGGGKPGAHAGGGWEFGNPIFRITFDKAAAERIRGLEKAQSELDFEHIHEALSSNWGLKYHFFLTDSIDESEYVVPWKAFAELCAKLGFRLVESLTFPEYLERAKRAFGARRLDLPQNVYDNVDKHLNAIAGFHLSKEQARVFALYKIFIFEKISRRDKLYIQGVKIKR